jgi:hypothetical protein
MTERIDRSLYDQTVSSSNEVLGNSPFTGKALGSNSTHDLPSERRMRLIALTGYGQADDRRRTLAAGFDGHLAKPVDLAKLERALAGSTAAGPGGVRGDSDE